MIMYRMPILIALMSIVYVYIVPLEPFGIKLVFKLIPMLMIFYYAVRMSPKEKQPVHWLILFALIFSMIGDATIQWFTIGLIAFFIGHVFYICGFLTQFRFSVVKSLIIVPLAIYGIWFSMRMVEALQLDDSQALIIPVILYIAAISLMALTAFMTGSKWAMLGSLLFIVSDSILAWNKFIGGIDHSHALIMLTYYGAQFFIAHSLHNLDGRRRRFIW
ncbi:Lysoplasmalogenase [Lentibacillus sp. JNUCC-1]|uniref:lysoplasmalogenase n=1 Tax=Lentibacillus sp. JNUCC-1 TaxID=2654513 RepID=UPI0012E7B7FE|nr:lysoplasmalogenase [Lentibacillus sp. JNUCC-1]MUV36622.1 Lysoplasmalogenase [Lentibacillus sp. JNUCC-1]